MTIAADIDLTTRDISDLTTADAVTAFLTRLGYPTDRREELTASAFGLTTDTADTIRSMELLAEDEEQFLRVVFVYLRSVTAKARNELARNLGKRGADHLLILTSDFDVIEFVLIDKETRRRHAPGGGPTVRIIPRVVAVQRKAAGLVERRILRRLTWTGKDGLDQFDKLRSVFESAHYAEKYFQNRALFADHYLERRLPEDDAWRDNPAEAFARTQELMRAARSRWSNKGEQLVRDGLYEPVWKLLGFRAEVNKSAKDDHLQPDYLLKGVSSNGQPATVAFVYRWDRWLDGCDPNDPDTPDENPGAAVVSALTHGDARWIIVTNGKYWRLYSKDAHSRSTNFYEIDLEEALSASAETDPNEAFRYWWLFFRQQAFITLPEIEQPTCWLDEIVRGSRDYAKRLGDRLKDRVFVEIFPHLAQGFLRDRKKRLGLTRRPSEDELRDAFEATLTLLYRLLFLLYAEARDLLPTREAAYRQASFQQIKGEIADKAGVAESEVPARLKVYPDAETTLYDRLLRLFAVMDKGDQILNVPCYNGGLFLATDESLAEPGLSERERRIARFLLDHKVPDRYLALAIDRLARDQDEKTLGLVFIDYKSLEVRHLGSIYEGLLEFKLKIAEEDLGLKTEKKAEKYIPLSQVRGARTPSSASRRRSTGGVAHATPVVRKGEVYLSNDKAERKATGSYYTPDPIVEYIVEHTVGPVLEEKLEALKPELDKASKTYHRHLANVRANRRLLSGDTDERSFAASKTYADPDVRKLVDQVFDMKVLDPAMGSGHFLVEAVDFITDRLLDFLNRYPHNPVRFMLDKTRRSILDALGEQGVTVDPDKLTDVNLLKRHVLKRCIYGVDLNPMAVELAKVSLWLDAFTLGAPLSFLDHHLRCGNSLIGATFEDLKRATGTVKGATTGGIQGAMFAIDYEPLLRAINKVLFVNAMADATAAEVHQSADEYAQARKELSGYQIVLDLLVADHFVGSAGVSPAGQSPERERAGYPRPERVRAGRGDEAMTGGRGSRRADVASAPRGRRGTAGSGRPPSRPSFKPSDLLRQASDLDLTTRDKLMASLDERAALLVEQVETVARRPDLRFFHWEIEFPEVFFGFTDSEQRQIKHKNDITAGSAGFDAIVGNPPYVRQESIKVFKEFLRTRYQTFGSTNDLYIYFQELEVCQLRVAGRMGMIVTNKWLRSNYGERLRTFLRQHARPISMLDFGHTPIFPDADTFPVVTIFERRPTPLHNDPPEQETVVVVTMPRSDYRPDLSLTPYVNQRGLDLPTRLLAPTGWSLENPRIQEVMQKILESSVPLRDWLDSSPFRGPGTGLNEAFYVDTSTRDRIIREHPPSAEIIKPLLRGRDIDRWRTYNSGLHILLMRRGIDIAKYPAIKAHLLEYKDRLEQRAGDQEWWELQASPSDQAVSASERPKIVYQEMAWQNAFALDLGGAILANTAYSIPADDLTLLAVLNSRLAWWFMWRTAQHGKDEVLRLIGTYMDQFPIPCDWGETKQQIESLARERLASLDQTEDLDRQLEDAVQRAYGLTRSERKLLEATIPPRDPLSYRMMKTNEGP